MNIFAKTAVALSLLAGASVAGFGSAQAGPANPSVGGFETGLVQDVQYYNPGYRRDGDRREMRRHMMRREMYREMRRDRMRGEWRHDRMRRQMYRGM